MMVEASNREEWRKIAEAVSQEKDPRKLAELAQQLIDAIDRAHKLKDGCAPSKSNPEIPDRGPSAV